MTVSADPVVDSDVTPPLWLLQFDGKTSNDLLWEPRFIALLQRVLPMISVPLCDGMGLPAVVADFLSGNPATVWIAEHRYLMVSVSRRHFASSKGLLWIDCRSAGPAIGFIARSYHRPGEDKVAIFANTRQPGVEVSAPFLASAIRWLLDGDANIVEVSISNSAGRVRFLDPQILGTGAPRQRVRRRARRRRASA